MNALSEVVFLHPKRRSAGSLKAPADRAVTKKELLCLISSFYDHRAVRFELLPMPWPAGNATPWCVVSMPCLICNSRAISARRHQLRRPVIRERNHADGVLGAIFGIGDPLKTVGGLETGKDANVTRYEETE